MHFLNKDMDQNLTWKITYTKIKQNHSVNIYDRQLDNKTFLLTENDIVYISCPKQTFCDFNHGSSLALHLNTINR